MYRLMRVCVCVRARVCTCTRARAREAKINILDFVYTSHSDKRFIAQEFLEIFNLILILIYLFYLFFLLLPGFGIGFSLEESGWLTF